MNEPGEVLFERRGEVVWLTLNRPQKANAMNIAMMATLVEHIDEAARDDTVKALVITGSGTRVFSGGVDVRSPSDPPPEELPRKRSEQFFRLLTTALEYPKPLVAAINGIASGGGLMLALTADRVIAAEGAAFALPEIDIGSPTFAGMAMLRHMSGTALAQDLALTARRMSAQEAHSRSPIAEVVAPDRLAARVQEYALLLAGKPQRAFTLSKQYLNRPLLAALHDAHHASEAARARA